MASGEGRGGLDASWNSLMEYYVGFGWGFLPSLDVRWNIGLLATAIINPREIPLHDLVPVPLVVCVSLTERDITAPGSSPV